ncbi:MAG: hypothetical protein HFH68_12250 [Lachnospiraceae bacterium]|nr:hypothetical protein [Lachnospiraceae bacterium]
MSEGNPIEKIAGVISNNDSDVMNDINICINDTDTYFRNNIVDYDERGITPESIEEGGIEEEEIRWLGMIDILEKYGYICEIDTSSFLEDFIDTVQDFNSTKSNNLPINADWFDEDADIFEWCEVLDSNWSSEGCCIANIEFSGDDLVLFPCLLEQLEELNGYAEEAGYSIKHAKDA